MLFAYSGIISFAYALKPEVGSVIFLPVVTLIKKEISLLPNILAEYGFLVSTNLEPITTSLQF